MTSTRHPKEAGMRSLLKQLTQRKDMGRTAGPRPGSLTIRGAVPGDERALARLAELDSSHAPRGAVLIAEVDGEAWAALSVDDGHAVADPFRLSGDLVALLAARGRRLRRNKDGFRTHPRVWPPSELDALHGEPAVR
jgi:hypothetical protein